MHYLTNYYKNLSEQLQEKLNILEVQYSLKPRTNILINAGAKYDSKSGTDLEIRKPIPDYILPGRMPRPADREPKPIKPEPTPKDPSKPSPLLTPGITPSNPSKIPIDLFKPGKRPKVGPHDQLYGSLPKSGDSNLIEKIPTEQETDSGKPMRFMKQSGIDLEGNPTGLTKSIPVKPKIDPRYKR